MSKPALNALTVYYDHALADEGIKVNALAPGLRRTDLNTAAAGDGDPAEAAAGAAANVTKQYLSAGTCAMRQRR